MFPSSHGADTQSVMKTPFLFALQSTLLLAVSAAQSHETDSFYLNEALVHHVKPATVTADHAVIMVPGHNLSSYIYLTTPDGREGWAQQFADAGYEVYVVNDPKFDFSRGFSVAGFTDVPTNGTPFANPNAQQAWGQDIWRRWGFGTSQGNPYADSKFPSDHFDDFENNYPWLSSGATHSFDGAIAALLEQVGPSIILAHSAGGPQGVSAAMQHPGLTAGLVLIEPTGPPTEANFPTLNGIAMLGVYADYIDSRNQGSRKTATIAAAALFEQNGGSGRIIDLPEDYGVTGNSHLMMQAYNNQFIGDLILDWAEQQAEVPREPGPGAGAGSGGGGKAGKKSKAGGKGGKGGKGTKGGGKGQLR